MRKLKNRDVNIDVTAYHEAGHVVVGLYLGCAIDEVMVDIDNPGDGITVYRPNFIGKFSGISLNHRTALSLWNQVLQEHVKLAKISLAGPLAEAKILAKPLRSLGAKSDLDKVMLIYDVLENIRENLSQYADISDNYRQNFSAKLRLQTRRILNKPSVWRAIGDLAHDLIHWHSLQGNDIAETVQLSMARSRQLNLIFS